MKWGPSVQCFADIKLYKAVSSLRQIVQVQARKSYWIGLLFIVLERCCAASPVNLWLNYSSFVLNETTRKRFVNDLQKLFRCLTCIQ